MSVSSSLGGTRAQSDSGRPLIAWAIGWTGPRSRRAVSAASWKLACPASTASDEFVATVKHRLATCTLVRLTFSIPAAFSSETLLLNFELWSPPRLCACDLTRGAGFLPVCLTTPASILLAVAAPGALKTFSPMHVVSVLIGTPISSAASFQLIPRFLRSSLACSRTAFQLDTGIFSLAPQCAANTCALRRWNGNGSTRSPSSNAMIASVTESGVTYGRRWPGLRFESDHLAHGFQLALAAILEGWRDNAGCTGIRMVSLARPRFLLNSATLTIAPLGAWPD